MTLKPRRPPVRRRAAAPASPGQKLMRLMAVKAARAAADKKGEDILLLHIGPVSGLADYLLIVSVTSPAHIDAVEESIRLSLKAAGLYPLHRDGRRSELWRVADYGGVLIHLMHPKAREFYALEKVFHDARPVRWEAAAAARADA